MSLINQRGRFAQPQVAKGLWCVPTDCKRFAKKVAEEGFCFGNPCETCGKLLDSDSHSCDSTVPASPTQSNRSAALSPQPICDSAFPEQQPTADEELSSFASCVSSFGSSQTSAFGALGALSSSDLGPHHIVTQSTHGTACSRAAQAFDGCVPSEAETLLLDSTRLVHRVCSAEGLLDSSREVDLSTLGELLAHGTPLAA